VASRRLVAITPPDGRCPLVFAWGVSSFFGWGVYDLNLGLTLATHVGLTPICTQPFAPAHLVLDPPREQSAAELHALSVGLWTALGQIAEPEVEDRRACADRPRHRSGPLRNRCANGDRGRPLIGVAFREHATLSPTGRGRAEQSR
jgi:hypothetical protein